MKTVSLDMWELAYKEDTNELILFINPSDDSAVIFSLNTGNVESFLGKISTVGQKQFVMNGQAMVPMTLTVISIDYGDLDEFYGYEETEYNYTLKHDLSRFKIGGVEPYSVEFDSETTRRMLESDVWNHPAIEWMTLPQ